MDIWIIFEIIDDFSHFQDPAQVNILGAFTKEDSANKFFKECEESERIEGRVIIEFLPIKEN